ncbi:MAG: phosphohistidine phosphatase [Paraglaciecola sp.]|jgi:phosphohistidine phosphatase
MAKVKTLYIMRHAEASIGVARQDIDRPLTMEGERDARHMGRWLNLQSPVPEKLYVSAAYRTKQTAEVVMEELHQQHTSVILPELYEASVRTLLSMVTAFEDNRSCLMIIAHNPAITYLADFLTLEPIAGMQPGAIIGLSFEVDTWAEVSQGSGEILFSRSPEPHG